jgi:hypothetical protein
MEPELCTSDYVYIIDGDVDDAPMLEKDTLYFNSVSDDPAAPSPVAAEELAERHDGSWLRCTVTTGLDLNEAPGRSTSRGYKEEAWYIVAIVGERGKDRVRSEFGNIRKFDALISV